MKTSNPSEANKHGKKFEAEVHSAFRDLFSRYPGEWKRTVDSAAAGNVIGKADGDFELTVKSPVYGCPYRFRIECKASIRYTSLAQGYRSLVKSHQNAKMILTERTGAVGVFLFCSVNTGEVEIWEARRLTGLYLHKRQKIELVPNMVVALSNLPALAVRWAAKPQEMLETLSRG